MKPRKKLSEVTKPKDGDREAMETRTLEHLEGKKSIPPSPQKNKVTYYISTHSEDALEEIYTHLRKKAGQDKKKIKKSAIVENAILHVYNELFHNTTESIESMVVKW